MSEVHIVRYINRPGMGDEDRERYTCDGRCDEIIEDWFGPGIGMRYIHGIGENLDLFIVRAVGNRIKLKLVDWIIPSGKSILIESPSDTTDKTVYTKIDHA